MFDYVQAKLNFKILGAILVCCTGGCQSSLNMCRLNLKFKIPDEILVCHTWGGSIIFDHVQAEYKLQNSR